MQDQQIAELGSLVTELESSGVSPNSDSLATLTRLLGKLFGVEIDEVAILKFVPKYKSLKFVIPEKLS